jgi:hypothetical protein
VLESEAVVMTRTRIVAKLHTGKIYSFPLHISKFVLLLLRQRRGAVAATSALRSSTCEKQRAAPRTSA